MDSAQWRASPGPLPSGTGLTVLVVDDDAVIRALVARTLTLAHFDVATAPTGKDALRLVAEGRVMPLILVTDIEMPEMNARHHPSIVDSVLLKPFALADLVRVVTDAGDQTRTR